MRISVVKKSHGIMMTSTLNLRTVGMSLSTFGSRSKNRWRLRKIYAPPNKLMMKKNVAAIRRAVRAWGLICASICEHIYNIIQRWSLLECKPFGFAGAARNQDRPERSRRSRQNDLVGHSLVSAKRCFRGKQVRSDVLVLVGRVRGRFRVGLVENT